MAFARNWRFSPVFNSAELTLEIVSPGETAGAVRSWANIPKLKPKMAAKKNLTFLDVAIISSTRYPGYAFRLLARESFRVFPSITSHD